MDKRFLGTGVAVVTPFRNNEVDFEALDTVINHLVGSDTVQYLVMLGTTGETPTLSKEEKFAILDRTAKVVNRRVPIVAGFGGNYTAKIVQQIQEYHFEGIDAILSSSPAYNKPTQEGVYQHFMAIAEHCPRPIILYNVPGRTASNMTAQTTLRLANASEQFIGIKEASGNLEQCAEIIKYKPTHFSVISGDDLLTLPLMSLGASGVISVIANAFPAHFSLIAKSVLANDYATAAHYHLLLLEMVRLLFVEGNPAGVKAALEIMGLCSSEVRLPLVSVSHSIYEAIRRETHHILAHTPNILAV